MTSSKHFGTLRWLSPRRSHRVRLGRETTERTRGAALGGVCSAFVTTARPPRQWPRVALSLRKHALFVYTSGCVL